MPELIYRKRSVSWRPVNNTTGATSYTANVTNPVFNVNAGEVVGLVVCRTVEAFDGTGTAAKFILGDGNDTDRFVADGDLEETSTSAATSIIQAVGGSGSTFAAIGRHLYTSADTIDVGFTAATGGDGTTGRVRITIWVARAEPV